MARVVLVTDIDTPLGNELVRLHLEAGDHVYATSSTEEALSSFGGAAEESLAVSLWRRGSPVSARNIVLQAVNTYDVVDELVLLGPPPVRGPLTQLDLADLERHVDRWVKGSLFFTREVLSHFERRGKGVIALVGTGAVEDAPLGGLLQGGFRGLTQALLKRHGEGGAIVANGFETGGPDAEGYAQFVHRSLQERARRISGRWFRHQSGLIANLKPISRA